MAVLEMVDKLANALDTKSCAMVIFIDLAKAFDTVDHKILLQKLSLYGNWSIPLNLLNDYIKEKKICFFQWGS